MIKTNAKEVWDEFDKLQTREMKKALVAGVRGTANQLKKEVKKELKSELPAANRNGRYGDRMLDGVRTTKVKEKKGFFYCYTTIATNRKKPSMGFLLHMFEAGTGDRYAYIRKDGHAKSYRGRIQPMMFYSKALAAFQSQQAVILDNEIEKAAKRINDKKITKPL